jgi:hypothetical protein
MERRTGQFTGKRRWHCVDCDRSFIADDIAAVDRRKLAHFDADGDPAEEAAALVKLFESGECDVEEIRELIRVSESERRCLEFLASAGMLASANVEAMVKFRADVLQQFNNLIDVEAACIPEPEEMRGESQ